MAGAGIRPAVPADPGAVLAPCRQRNPADLAPDPGRAAVDWSQPLGSAMTTVPVAPADGRPVATCVLVVVPNLTRGARPCAIIENVVTDAAHRRQGHAGRLLQAALDRAWQAGCYKVMLATGSRSEATLRFYESAGFERGGRTFLQARRP
ncbi:GNAT family N-acetyltransferase [Paracraurococcus ruber]|uniref:N-acetyltransferase domain-containing protein n=1 Tax=Paracraurococcus ruber TaxID=77675 RepID=A0ABS1CSJ2_9PROT|nr:GNAT family N-acetyltransferase [Paracraurococcus ruber]MBK1657156.1 hypothetical protein [Paracraurococcus ruber]TDG31134.1 GNAT family N-acetyltransferase [Paracraurococcus ruber]